MEKYRDMVSEASQRISNKLPGIKKSMGIYLCNPDTEAILFRPIRTQVINQYNFLRKEIEKLDEEDQFIINCPSSEQLTLTLNYEMN